MAHLEFFVPYAVLAFMLLMYTRNAVVIVAALVLLAVFGFYGHHWLAYALGAGAAAVGALFVWWIASLWHRAYEWDAFAREWVLWGSTSQQITQMAVALVFLTVAFLALLVYDTARPETMLFSLVLLVGVMLVLAMYDRHSRPEFRIAIGMADGKAAALWHQAMVCLCALPVLADVFVRQSAAQNGWLAAALLLFVCTRFWRASKLYAALFGREHALSDRWWHRFSVFDPHEPDGSHGARGRTHRRDTVLNSIRFALTWTDGRAAKAKEN